LDETVNPRSTALIPDGMATAGISQLQPNPQPPMNRTSRFEQSFYIRTTSLALVVLMLPLSVRGYAQTTVSQSIPTGVALTDSNSVITEVKNNEPESPEKLIADINATVSMLESDLSKVPKPELDSSDSILNENITFLKKELLIEDDLIKRIDAIFEKQQTNSVEIPEKYKSLLTNYRKEIIEHAHSQTTYIYNISSELNKRAKGKAEVAKDETAASTAPTPSATPWYKTDTAQQKYWIIGSAAALGIIAVLQEWGKKAVDNAMKQ
jgi:hypothetical protein